MKAVLLLLLCIIAGYTYAEISPYALAKMQENSEEQLKIKAVVVRVTAEDKTTDSVEVEAVILRVYKTYSNLEPGDTIVIKYKTHKTSWTDDNGDECIEIGPAPDPILTEGKIYPAFLKKMNDYYEPSAVGVSFSEYIKTE